MNSRQILLIVQSLVQAALADEPDLANDTGACILARDIVARLDGLRVCSECGLASKGATDVCGDCWPAYQARCRAEDEAAGQFYCPACGVYVGGEGLCANCEDDRAAAEDELDDARECADGPFVCRECEAPIPSYGGTLCDRCKGLEADEQRDRDWEGEALALREAELDAAVSPFGED